MTPETYTLVTIVQTGLVIVAVVVSLALVHQANASRDRAWAETDRATRRLFEIVSWFRERGLTVDERWLDEVREDQR